MIGFKVGQGLQREYLTALLGSNGNLGYAELRDEVAVFANVLHNHGVGKGDRVIVYMPMIPEALISVLACARIGANLIPLQGL